MLRTGLEFCICLKADISSKNSKGTSHLDQYSTEHRLYVLPYQIRHSCLPDKVFLDFTHFGYFCLIPGGIRQPHA